MEPLDGTRWRATFRGAAPMVADTLSFAEGTFHGPGAASARYRASEERGRTAFFADVVTGTGDAERWTGVREGDRLEGSLVVVGRGGEVSMWLWTGKRVR